MRTVSCGRTAERAAAGVSRVLKAVLSGGQPKTTSERLSSSPEAPVTEQMKWQISVCAGTATRVEPRIDTSLAIVILQGIFYLIGNFVV